MYTDQKYAGRPEFLGHLLQMWPFLAQDALGSPTTHCDSLSTGWVGDLEGISRGHATGCHQPVKLFTGNTTSRPVFFWRIGHTPYMTNLTINWRECKPRDDSSCAPGHRRIGCWVVGPICFVTQLIPSVRCQVKSKGRGLNARPVRGCWKS